MRTPMTCRTRCATSPAGESCCDDGAFFGWLAIPTAAEIGTHPGGSVVASPMGGLPSCPVMPAHRTTSERSARRRLARPPVAQRRRSRSPKAGAPMTDPLGQPNGVPPYQ